MKLSTRTRPTILVALHSLLFSGLLSFRTERLLTNAIEGTGVLRTRLAHSNVRPLARENLLEVIAALGWGAELFVLGTQAVKYRLRQAFLVSCVLEESCIPKATTVDYRLDLSVLALLWLWSVLQIERKPRTQA